MSNSLCKERILSEDYRDFILDGIQTSFLSDIALQNSCIQNADFDYCCVYIPAIQAEPITLKQFPYASIPKCYAPISMETLNQTGILSIQNYPTLQLKGKGVLIGFLDSGIDYLSPLFRNLDGSTRILSIWDQTIQIGTPPDNFYYGSEYTQPQINDALASEQPLNIVPSQDGEGHGTFVASLACGGGTPQENFLGAAPEATLAVVKLKPAKQYLRDYYFIADSATAYQETDILLAVKYLSDLAAKYKLPLILCIALGTNSGGHLGLLPLSNLLDLYASKANIIPVTGVGNEANGRHHFQYTLKNIADSATVEIRVGEGVPGFTLELWNSIPNILAFSIVSPSGEIRGRNTIRTTERDEFQFLLEGTTAIVDYKLLVERTNQELIFFRFQKPSPGIWKIIVSPLRIIDGLFHMWLPLSSFIQGEVFFLNSNPYYTITNPGNASRPICVSYYDGNTNAIALDSGRGYDRYDGIHPDFTAPGISILSSLPNNRFAVRSGSSLSVAITAGACALLLEWILFQLGTESVDSTQIKSLFIIGATRPSNMTFPNPEWGYGQLNLFHTFEELRNY